jgi:hypothetical protein
MPDRQEPRITLKLDQAEMNPVRSPNVGSQACGLPAEVRAEILSMVREPDWDGLGAKAVPASACRAAVAFLEMAVAGGMPLPKFICPSPMGRVSLQWNLGDRKLYAEIESTDPQGCYFRVVSGGEKILDGRAGPDRAVEQLALSMP